MKRSNELGGLFQERDHRTKGCRGVEDFAMLVFYLPIIVFEVMLEADTKKREIDDSDATTLAEPTAASAPLIQAGDAKGFPFSIM
jgi:hypothetical protein